MKARDIERHLRINVPLYSDRFHSWIDVNTYTVASNVATITTTVAHGLSVDDEININGVVFKNPLNDIVNQKDGTALASTTYPDDLTFTPDNPTITNQKTTITIEGADNVEFNGTFNLTSVLDRRNFYFEFPVGAPLHANGSPILLEDNLVSLNGIFTVVSTPNVNTFTLAVEKEDFTAPAGAKFYSLGRVRIAADVSAQRAQEAYSRQPNGEYWMFIIPDDTTVSRDRRVASDFTYRHEAGAYYRQETEEPLFIHVYIPAVDDYTPVDGMDEARNELKVAILKSIMAFFPDNLFFNGYTGIFYSGDGTVSYNNALYIHQYNFASTVEIVAEDAYIPNSTAIHTIDGTLTIELDN